jgi:hypothetical protein
LVSSEQGKGKWSTERKGEGSVEKREREKAGERERGEGEGRREGRREGGREARKGEERGGREKKSKRDIPMFCGPYLPSFLSLSLVPQLVKCIHAISNLIFNNLKN